MKFVDFFWTFSLEPAWQIHLFVADSTKGISCGRSQMLLHKSLLFAVSSEFKVYSGYRLAHLQVSHHVCSKFNSFCHKSKEQLVQV